MIVFALKSVRGIRNSERLFVNTKLCSNIVRFAQWKNKMVIFDRIVFFLNRDSCKLDGDLNFLRWNTHLCLDWQNSSVRYGCSAPNFSKM